MPNLYIITGPAGVGKSTISNMIAESKEKSALIEGDTIYHQVIGGYEVAWKEGNHLDTFWKVCIRTIGTYLDDGYDVVFNYIINPDNLNQLANEFKKYNDVKIKFAVLMTDEATLLSRDKLRPENHQMNERCIALLKSFKKYGFDERFVVDNSNMSARDVVKAIEKDEGLEV